MNQQQELTAKTALVILNSHIDNVVKGTCGKEGNDPSWGLNEINSILQCIATIKIRLDRAELEEKELAEMQKESEVRALQLESMMVGKENSAKSKAK